MARPKKADDTLTKEQIKHLFNCGLFYTRAYMGQRFFLPKAETLSKYMAGLL